MPAGWAAAAAGVVGAGVSAYGSMTAADTQANAARNATNAEVGMFTQTQNNLLPFLQGGTTALQALESGTGLPITQLANNQQVPAMSDAQREQMYQAPLKLHGGDEAAAAVDWGQRMQPGGLGFTDLLPGA